MSNKTTSFQIFLGLPTWPGPLTWLSYCSNSMYTGGAQHASSQKGRHLDTCHIQCPKRGCHNFHGAYRWCHCQRNTAVRYFDRARYQTIEQLAAYMHCAVCKLTSASRAAEVTEMLSKIGQVVATLHDGGLVHGDLTTSNLLIRQTDKAVVSQPDPKPSCCNSVD